MATKISSSHSARDRATYLLANDLVCDIWQRTDYLQVYLERKDNWCQGATLMHYYSPSGEAFATKVIESFEVRDLTLEAFVADLEHHVFELML